MLRSVCFKNFVKFKEHQRLDLQKDGPFIFVGENGSGKSSVFEGIRRCLKSELSTTVSSSADSNQMSYFICNFEIGEKETVMCGIVSLPDIIGQKDVKSLDVGDDENTIHLKNDLQSQEIEDDMETDDTGQDQSTSERQRMTVDENIGDDNASQQLMGKRKCTTNVQNSTKVPKYDIHDKAEGFKDAPETAKDQSKFKSYYKFVLKYSANSANVPMHINCVDVSKTSEGDTEMNISNRDDVDGTAFKECMDKNQTSDGKSIEEYIQSVFGSLSAKSTKDTNDCNEILESLSREIVFTFPMRTIGPLQWSESRRVDPKERENNYAEAEGRCEIIKCFLEDNNDTFDKEKEQEYFKQITQSDDYQFELKDGKIALPNGKYALLKTPEGILEAKAFAILLSSKIYRTLILEEPDKGMHPQFIERMAQIMKQKKKEKRVILTTHNTTFITAWTVPDTFIFRRHETECRIISGRSLVGDGYNTNMKKIRLLTSDHISDILFAKRVLFFEGDSELLFFTEVKRQILAGESRIAQNMFTDDVEGYENLKKSLIELTFIKMNGKDKVDPCQDMCKQLQLEHICLLDRDAVTSIRQKGKNKDERVEEEKASNNRTPEEWLKIRSELWSNYIFFWRDGNIEKMVRKISCNNDTLEDKLNKVITRGKLFLGENCDSSEIKETVKLILDTCRPEHDLAEFIKILKRN